MQTRLVARLCTMTMLLGGVPQPALAQSLAKVAALTEAGGRTTMSEPVGGSVHLLVGRSTVLDIAGPIARVSLSKPDIADALITSSQQLLVHGKAPGTISLMVWERNGVLRRYEVDVQRDLSSLNEELQRLFPGEPMAATVSGRRVVIAGTVSSSYVIEKAAAVATGYVEKTEDVVNLLRQQQGVASNQVLLRVRFAEVSRNALTELGASFFTGAGGYKDYVARSTTQQFPAPVFDAEKGGLVFSDFLNLLLFNTKHQIGTLVRALQNKGLFQTLAEPNLVAETGKEASFLAGGEYPYPVAQSTGSGLAIAIHFKEFGIKLNFTPTILGPDLIHLKVKPEVSSLDFANAVSLEGFRIPALTTRRTETEIELRDGQTFAIAGLLNNVVTSSMQKIPGIGDIPVLGLLFRSKAAQKAQTELVVMITPEILRRDSSGAASGLPGLVEPFLPPPSKVMPAPMPTPPGTPRSREPAETPAAPVAVTAPVMTPTPAEAPATVPAPTASPAPQGTPARPAAIALETARPAAIAPATARPEQDTRKRLEEARKQRESEIKGADAERKRAAKAQKVQQEREAEARRAAEKVQKQKEEQAKKAAAAEAKRSAEDAKKAAEEAKKNEEAARKQQKALSEAEARLKQAEAAYQAAVERTSKGGKQ